MTTVDFHTGVADKLGYTCRLLRKVYRSGNRVVVAGAPDQLDRLHNLLWAFETGEFIPHLRLLAGQALLPQALRTPIWLVDRPDAVERRDVLVNLGPDMAAGYPRYPRVIEVVAEPADEVASGRQRWRQYLAAGHAPTNHPPASA